MEPTPGTPAGIEDAPAAVRPAGRRGGATIVAVVAAAAALAVGSLALVRSGGHGGGHAAVHHGKAVLASAQTNPLVSGATISVTGTGSLEGTPDTVSFSIGIHTTDSSATSALDANSAQVQTLEATLERNGVAARDMQTSSLAIYDTTDSSGTITGFAVDDDLNVNMTDVASAGRAIDAAAHAVGDGISLGGISFSISNESRLLARARAAAMTNARTEAEQVASGAGLALGPVVKVTDEENSSPGPVYPLFAEKDLGGVPLSAGRQPVSVQVSVVYQLRA